MKIASTRVDLREVFKKKKFKATNNRKKGIPKQKKIAKKKNPNLNFSTPCCLVIRDGMGF